MRHVLNKLALVHSININNDDNTKPKLLTFRNDSELFKAFKTSKMLVRCISDGRSLLCDLVMPIPMHIPPFHHLWKMGFAIWISSTFELHYISVEMVTRVKCSSNLNGILCDFDLGILAFQHIILQIPKSTLWHSPNSLSFSLEFSFIELSFVFYRFSIELVAIFIGMIRFLWIFAKSVQRNHYAYHYV